MKKIIITLATALLAVPVLAQQMPPIPADPAVRIGKLDNGLTYYIRHNEEPQGQANFYIAQKVGSILEEEQQRGLAHFLEHMCFNGTQNFPGNGIIKYCESIGVKFGADLNAYTSVDETVYNIDNVPVGTVPSAVDSCLLILHDWADGLLLNDADIDSERGVIHEEWRGRRSSSMRMIEQYLPVIYPGNRYGERLPIGLMEVVDNFPYQVLRDYYETWYRPDQQGIVVVGDIDVDAVEAKIKDVFGPIQMPADPKERVYFPVEDNAEPIIFTCKDKEEPYATTMVFLKHDAYPAEMKNDLNYMVYLFAKSAIQLMLSERISEIRQSPQPPFVNAAVYDGEYFISKTKDAFQGEVISSENDVLKASTTLYREMLRAVRNGFTESEFERAKAKISAELESQYNSRDKRKSGDFCREYVRHFIDNEPIPGIENEFSIFQQLLPVIPVEMVNQLVASFAGEGNLVVVATLPDKEGVTYPSEAEIAAAFKAVEEEEIAPYVDAVSDEALIPELPVPGKVVKVKEAALGYKLYVLSNGVKVYYKQTDFDADEILMKAFSHGGSSLYPDSYNITLKNINALMGIGGLGNFSKTNLTKVLAGKKARISPSVNMFSESVSGSTTPKDFETMLQLTYLQFTALRSDEQAFESWRNREKASLLNMESQPMTALQDTIYRVMYSNYGRVSDTKADQIDLVDYELAMKIASERFSNAADFTFVFTGNLEESVAVPMFEQYIASLPSGGKKEKGCLKVNDYRKGVRSAEFERAMEQPMVTNVFVDNSKPKVNLKSELSYDIATSALTTVLLEEIREKEGGTYGINAVGSMNAFPRRSALLQVIYQTSPERYEYLNGRVREILNDFAKNGPRAEDVAKSKEYLLKNYKESLRENSYHQAVFQKYLECGIDEMTDFENTLESVTVEDVRLSVANILKAGNHVEIIMKGTANK